MHARTWNQGKGQMVPLGFLFVIEATLWQSQGGGKLLWSKGGGNYSIGVCTLAKSNFQGSSSSGVTAPKTFGFCEQEDPYREHGSPWCQKPKVFEANNPQIIGMGRQAFAPFGYKFVTATSTLIFALIPQSMRRVAIGWNFLTIQYTTVIVDSILRSESTIDSVYYALPTWTLVLCLPTIYVERWKILESIRNLFVMLFNSFKTDENIHFIYRNHF